MHGRKLHAEHIKGWKVWSKPIYVDEEELELELDPIASISSVV